MKFLKESIAQKWYSAQRSSDCYWIKSPFVSWLLINSDYLLLNTAHFD